MEISGIWKRGFDAAKAASEYSDGIRTGRKMGAALFSGAKLISIGFNLYNKTHPESGHLKKVHAEQSALLKRRHYDNSNNLTMYVWRSTSLGPSCSKPCPMCESLMSLAGVGRVRYIDQNGNFKEMKL
jgi:deoxycytidylate deaminase